MAKAYTVCDRIGRAIDCRGRTRRTALDTPDGDRMVIRLCCKCALITYEATRGTQIRIIRL